LSGRASVAAWPADFGRLDHIDSQHGIEKILGLQDHSVVDIGMLRDGRMN
jgi:hypothetical protein